MQWRRTQTLCSESRRLRGIDKKPIELIWWDPTIEDPPIQIEHRKPVELNRIHIFIPPKLRRKEKGTMERLRTLFSLPDT